MPPSLTRHTDHPRFHPLICHPPPTVTSLPATILHCSVPGYLGGSTPAVNPHSPRETALQSRVPSHPHFYKPEATRSAPLSSTPSGRLSQAFVIQADCLVTVLTPSKDSPNILRNLFNLPTARRTFVLSRPVGFDTCIVTCIRHDSIIQTGFTALKNSSIFLLLYLPARGRQATTSLLHLYNSAFPRMSYQWKCVAFVLSEASFT